MACSAERSSELATGSLVKVRLGQAASMAAVASGFWVIFSMPWLARALAWSGLALTKSLAATWASSSFFTAAGWSFRYSVRTMRWVVTNWPPGHRLALVDQDLAAALVDQAGDPRLGHPGAVDGAGAERLQGLGVLLGDDAHVAAALQVGLEVLAGEPAAQGDVLGVAPLGRGQLLALEVGGVGDLGLDHEGGPARRGAGDDADGLPLGLGVGVDGRVGADVGGVEGPVEEGLDRRRAGVER